MIILPIPIPSQIRNAFNSMLYAPCPMLLFFVLHCTRPCDTKSPTFRDSTEKSRDVAQSGQRTCLGSRGPAVQIRPSRPEYKKGLYDSLVPLFFSRGDFEGRVGAKNTWYCSSIGVLEPVKLKDLGSLKGARRQAGGHDRQLSGPKRDLTTRKQASLFSRL